MMLRRRKLSRNSPASSRRYNTTLVPRLGRSTVSRVNSPSPVDVQRTASVRARPRPHSARPPPPDHPPQPRARRRTTPRARGGGGGGGGGWRRGGGGAGGARKA